GPPVGDRHRQGSAGLQGPHAAALVGGLLPRRPAGPFLRRRPHAAAVGSAALILLVSKRDPAIESTNISHPLLAPWRSRMRGILWLSPALLLWAAPARGDEAAEARKVLDKAIQALGGQDKLAKLDAVTWKSKGKLTVEGVTVEFQDELSVSGTDRLRW